VRDGTRSAKHRNITIDDESLRTFRRYGRWTETLSGSGAWIWSMLSIAGTPEDCREMWGSLERLHMHTVEGKLVQILDVIPASTFHTLEISLTDEELLLLPGWMAHLPNIRSLILRRRTHAARGSRNRASVIHSLSTALGKLKNLRTVWLPVIFAEMPVLIELGGLPLLAYFGIASYLRDRDDNYRGLSEALRLLGREKRSMFPSLQTLHTNYSDYPHLPLDAFRMSRLETLNIQIAFCCDTSDPGHRCAMETFDHISQFKTLRFLTLEIHAVRRGGQFIPFTLPPNFFSSLGMLTNLERLAIRQNDPVVFPLPDLIEATSKWTLMEELLLEEGQMSFWYLDERMRNLNILSSIIRNMPNLHHLRMCFDHFTPVDEPMGSDTSVPKLKRLTFDLGSFEKASAGDAPAVAEFLATYVQVVVNASWRDHFWTAFKDEWHQLKTVSEGLIVVTEEAEPELDEEEGLLSGLMG
jgi:hypothetical protein